MEAIVLAGGFGTRLQKVVSDVPKPMAPIGDKPFLEYLLKYLQKNGIRKVILSVGYKWEVIKEYFGDKFGDIDIIYSIEEEPLGTGGAVSKAMNLVQNEYAFVLNGDTFFDIDLSSMSLKEGSLLQLSLKKMYAFDRYGCVETVNGHVVKFTEKRYHKEGTINGGVYLASKNIFDVLSANKMTRFSFENFMEENIDKLKITAKVFEDYFIDIGIPEDYEKAQEDLKAYL